MNSPTTLTDSIKASAHELGFQLVGACPAARPPGAERLDEWLAAGFAGEMHYLAERRDAYHDPQLVLQGARSVVMLGMAYQTETPRKPTAGQGRVSRYAWGECDYHQIIRDRLHELADAIRQLAPESRTRCVVDTAPLLERDFARLAGLGWIGKNTLLINKPEGSYFFLAAVLTDLELDYDEPFATDHCGSCTACLDACPTDAFPQPYVLDARRCISYLTIELRDHIPAEHREGMGDWLFGCDVCQDVCPWNNKTIRASEPAFDPLEGRNPAQLEALFSMDDQSFRKTFRRTPLWRAHREGLLRNAAIVLGNQQAEECVPALIRGLNDSHPMVRGACAWALGKFQQPAAKRAIAERLVIETDPAVLLELQPSQAET